MPYSVRNFFVAEASSCEIPKKATPSPPYSLNSRSRKGKVNWHTGQEILKNAATTGPFCSSAWSEYSFPSRLFKEKFGAVLPAMMFVISRSVPIQLDIRRRIPTGQLYLIPSCLPRVSRRKLKFLFPFAFLAHRLP